MQKIKHLGVLVLFISSIALARPSSIASAHPLFATTVVNLGTSDTFAVLAGSAISDTGATLITGDVGLSPTGGSAISGLTCSEVSGTIYDTNAGYTGGGGGSTACLSTNPSLLTTAKNDLTAAYVDAAARVASTIGTELGGVTLLDGVYDSASTTFEIVAGGTLTLDGGGDANSVFIFKMGSTLTTFSNSAVLLINGAQACNVFWQVGSSATLGTNSTFVGNILADQSITDTGGSTIDGRFLARNAAVTLNNTTLSRSVCAAATNTPTPTVTSSNTATQTPTATSTSTNTLNPTSTATATLTASNTPSPTATFSATPSSTLTASNTPSQTATPSNTFTPSNTPLAAASSTLAPAAIASGSSAGNLLRLGLALTPTANSPVLVGGSSAGGTGAANAAAEGSNTTLISGQLRLPSSGFAPSGHTELGEQPAVLAFVTSDLVLEIPNLDVSLDITGVPLVDGNWDVTWLTPSQAGYLYGTIFPTWVGNSVLTAHVWNADNTAGPFYHLKNLKFGDQFTIIASGQTYVYEVRSNRLVSATNMSVLEDSDYSLVTLITCEFYRESDGTYLYRRAVQAVLVEVY